MKTTPVHRLGGALATPLALAALVGIIGLARLGADTTDIEAAARRPNPTGAAYRLPRWTDDTPVYPPEDWSRGRIPYGRWKAERDAGRRLAARD